jgi:hypothetical protein
MKKTVLALTTLITSISFAQLDQSNEPIIGESTDMFLCDSFATNYANVTGPAVTWDYSDLASYFGETRTVEVVDPSATAYASTFNSSTKALQLGDNITTYFTSDANGRYSQGFLFVEPTLGDVVATFETDELTQLTYPFGYGSTVNDAYSGTIEYNVFAPTTGALAGNANIAIDGEGTLSLPLGVDLTGVIRLRSIDTALTNEPFLLGDIEVIREQYEYYDLADQNLPVFIHSTITIQQVGATTPLASSSIVLSKYATENFVGLNENNTAKVVVYPIPAKESITVSGMDLNNAKLTVFDQSGKIVKQINEQSGNELSINDLNSGIYMLTVEKDGVRSMTKFVKD